MSLKSSQQTFFKMKIRLIEAYYALKSIQSTDGLQCECNGLHWYHKFLTSAMAENTRSCQKLLRRQVHFQQARKLVSEHFAAYLLLSERHRQERAFLKRARVNYFESAYLILTQISELMELRMISDHKSSCLRYEQESEQFIPDGI
jgi:hypothetical protein